MDSTAGIHRDQQVNVLGRPWNSVGSRSDGTDRHVGNAERFGGFENGIRELDEIHTAAGRWST